jgi:hypothetical protein
VFVVYSLFCFLNSQKDKNYLALIAMESRLLGRDGNGKQENGLLKCPNDSLLKNLGTNIKIKKLLP